MQSQTSIFLVGPMGSGKTAVGRQLARALGWHFYDSDTQIESRTGVDIRYIFEREGESGFRQRECEILEELTARTQVVVATGGGAVLRPENRRVLSTRGRVVYLETSVQQQLERTRSSQHRPLLLDTDPATRLHELLQIREPLYKEVAAITVTTDGKRVAAVVEEILSVLHSQPGIG